MLKKVTFKDEQNGVSAIITDHGEGTPPEVSVKDNASDCTLDVPKDSDLYHQLVGLSQTWQVPRSPLVNREPLPTRW